MPAFPILQDTRVEHCSGYTWSLESSEAARLWFNHCQSGETKQVIETSSACVYADHNFCRVAQFMPVSVEEGRRVIVPAGLTPKYYPSHSQHKTSQKIRFISIQALVAWSEGL